jgi:hypothetical protein
MHEHIHMLESHQLLDDVERQVFEVVGIQKREMQARRIERIDNIVDGKIRRFVVNDRGATNRTNALVQGVSLLLIDVVEVQFGKSDTAGMGSLVGD